MPLPLNDKLGQKFLKAIFNGKTHKIAFEVRIRKYAKSYLTFKGKKDLQQKSGFKFASNY